VERVEGGWRASWCVSGGSAGRTDHCGLSWVHGSGVGLTVFIRLLRFLKLRGGHTMSAAARPPKLAAAKRAAPAAAKNKSAAAAAAVAAPSSVPAASASGGWQCTTCNTQSVEQLNI
jgi:hypothetical protein